MTEVMGKLEACLERLSSAMQVMEAAGAQWKENADAQGSKVGKITAAVDTGMSEAGYLSSTRELDLERKLREAEGALALLQANSQDREDRSSPRKTLPAATVQLLAKQGLDAEDGMDLRSLDAALAGLSVEHRIAVKSQLLRTGAQIR